MIGNLFCRHAELRMTFTRTRYIQYLFRYSFLTAIVCIVAGCIKSNVQVDHASAIDYQPSTIQRGNLPGYDAFYVKHLKAGEMHIASSDKIPDAGLHEAAYLMLCVLDGREDVQKAIADGGIHLAVMSHDEFTIDIPEHADLTPAKWWNRRARGLGATKQRPAMSAGAENLLDYPGDPYKGENILIHEFAHVVHHFGFRKVDPTFDQKLNKAYDEAKKAGKWNGTYAITNADEYWAEGVQIYFECNPAFTNHSHGEVNLRSELKKYDPLFFDLLDQSFKGNPFKYTPVRERSKQPHLRDWDFERSPTFAWPEGQEE